MGTNLANNVDAPEKLTGGVNCQIVAVDVSNVCLDKRLPGSGDFDRLELVLDAWEAQLYRGAEFHLVADRSLLSKLTGAAKQVARRMERRGELTVCPVADDVLLSYAEEHDGCVLSRDRFLAERPGRAWKHERLFTWNVDGAGVRIIEQPSRNTQPFDISRAVEWKLSRSRGFPGLDHAAVRQRWRCVSTDPCLTRETTPAELKVLPILRDDVALCPGCEQPLQALGERPFAVELKVMYDEIPVTRFSLEQGEEVAFGRLRMPDTAKLAELAGRGAFAGIGRAHADLRIVDRRLEVRPVDERHRVDVIAWDARRRRFLKPRALHHGDFSSIAPRDVLLLGGRLELVRSGRSIAEAEGLSTGADVATWRRRSTAAAR